ncbi:MAG: hypothetical protein V4539_16715 [Bacteroidota bacterium]
MDLLTIEQLDEWLTANCFNDSYAIGNRIVHEGFGLDTFGSLYVWYYTERGERTNFNYFQTEKEAVAFAFEKITSDKFANRHMVGFIKDKTTETDLLNELGNRNIQFWKDEIPYDGINDTRIRVFVFGCDIKRVLDLQKQFGV